MIGKKTLTLIGSVAAVVLITADAQQRIRPEQVRTSANTASRVFMFQPNGNIVLADLDDATLVLDASSGKTVLRAAPQTQKGSVGSIRP